LCALHVQIVCQFSTRTCQNVCWDNVVVKRQLVFEAELPSKLLLTLTNLLSWVKILNWCRCHRIPTKGKLKLHIEVVITLTWHLSTTKALVPQEEQ
jgi:hypothetical protein